MSTRPTIMPVVDDDFAAESAMEMLSADYAVQPFAVKYWPSKPQTVLLPCMTRVCWQESGWNNDLSSLIAQTAGEIRVGG